MSPSASPVPVLGMHRSGTSVATRLIGLAGAVLPGEAGPGRTSNAANAKGFWEIRPLTDFNETVLQALGGEWSAPPPLPDGWPADPRLDSLRRTARTLERRHLSAGVVWKDPRLCLTLPFWAEVCPATAPAVLVVRNPLEIVASLEARDSLAPEVAFALWERYLRSALEVMAGRPAFVLSYEDVVMQPAVMAEQIRSWLDGVGVATRAMSSASEIDAFVAGNLRHTRHEDADVASHEGMTEGQKALHVALTALVGAHARLAPPVLPFPPSGDEVLEVRRANRVSARRARYRWDRRVKRAVLLRGSLLARRLRNSG